MFHALSNPSCICLEKEDVTCRILYDNVLERISDPKVKDGFVSINSIHNCPDFIITLEKDGEIFDTKVVEVKWRSLENIYSTLDDTKTVDHLRDYFNLGYQKCSERKTIRGLVDRVICVYPDAYERLTEIQYDEIVAIGLLPNDDLEQSKGYAILKNLLIANTNSWTYDV